MVVGRLGVWVWQVRGRMPGVVFTGMVVLGVRVGRALAAARKMTPNNRACAAVNHRELQTSESNQAGCVCVGKMSQMCCVVCSVQRECVGFQNMKAVRVRGARVGVQ